MSRDDVNELKADLQVLRDTDFEDGPDANGAARLYVSALESALNCIRNLGDELADLEAKVKRLERDR